MTKELTIRGGHKVLIDDADWDLVQGYNWYVAALKRKYPYFHIRANYRIEGEVVHVLMHRLIMDAKQGQIVDHINSDSADNRRENLRFVTRGQNMQNSKARAHSKSGVRNVSFEARSGLFLATVRADKVRYRKRFKSMEDASAWATAKRKELHGEFAYDASKDARLAPPVD